MGSYKYYGRLTGKTLAMSALSETSPYARRSPFSTQVPGTKAMAQGEAALSSSINRYVGAVAANVDSIKGLMDLPTTRDDTLHYFTNATTGFAGSGKFGFPALTISNPLDLAAGTYIEVNLGEADVASSIEPPSAWVYVGFTKENLTSGRTMRLYRDARKSSNESGSSDDDFNAAYASTGNPLYVKPYSGAADFHGTQSFLGVSPHSRPDTIPPIAQVSTDLPPYGGGAVNATVSSWEPDGVVLQSTTWDTLHVRPGCYVLVDGAETNNGLYQVVSVAGYKAVLTRGNLIKVTMASGGGAGFTAGQLVSWQSPPNHTATGAKLSSRTNFAYVMYKSTDTLYLGSVAGWEDFPVAANTGSRVANVVSTADSVTALSSSLGRDGLVDAEASNTSNANLPAGTRLYPVSYASIGATTSYVVESVVPASYPVVFSTTTTAGTASPCNPPGFLLNPVVCIGRASIGTVDNKSIAGNFFLKCRTLTTVREKLLGAGSEIDKITADDPSLLPSGHDNDYETQTVKAALRSLHQGSQTKNALEDGLNDWASPTRSILGATLWIVGGDDGGGNGLGAKFEDGTLSAGDRLTFAHPDAGCGNTTAVVITGWDDYLIVRDAVRTSGWTSANIVDYGTVRSIKVGSTVTVSGTPYTLTAAVVPLVKMGAGATDTECPPMGLDAVYSLMYDSDYYERSSGRGNIINLVDGRPLTLFMDNLSPGATAMLLEGDDGYLLFCKQKLDGTGHVALYADATGQARLGLSTEKLEFTNFIDADTTSDHYVDWSTNTFLFNDAQTTTPIPLSSTGALEIPQDYGDRSIAGVALGARSGSSYGGAAASYGTSTAVLSGGLVTLSSGTTVSLTQLFFTASGTLHTWPAGNYVFPDVAATRYLFLDMSDLTTASSTTKVGISIDYTDAATYADFPNSPDKLYLAKVVCDGAGGITSITDLRKNASRLDEKLSIYVGNIGTSDTYAGHRVHFTTISAAHAAISEWYTAGTAYARGYEIVVVGAVTESDTITLLVGDLTIRGLGPDGVSSVTMTANAPLFDINGMPGIVIQDLVALNSNGTKITAGAPSAVFATNSDGATVGWSCTLRNIGFTPAASTYRLAALWYCTAAGFGDTLLIEDCNIYGGISCTAVVHESTNGMDRIIIRDNYFKCGALVATTSHLRNKAIKVDCAGYVQITNNVITGTTGVTASFLGGIHVDSGTTILVKDNQISQIEDYPAIDLESSCGDGAVVSGNDIRGVVYSAVANGHGISISGSYGAAVRDNYIATVDRHGIYFDSPNGTVSGNRITTVYKCGIYVAGSASDRGVSILNNNIVNVCIDDTSGDAGISYNVGNGHITGNYVSVATSQLSNVDAAILVTGNSSTAIDSVIVSSNVLGPNAANGVAYKIELDDSNYSSVIGNRTGGGDILTSGSNLQITSNNLGGGMGAAVNISSSTDASPVVVTTSSAHNLSTGDRVYISGHTSNSGINGMWIVTYATATTFSLDNSTGTGSAGTANGTIQQMHVGNIDTTSGEFLHVVGNNTFGGNIDTSSSSGSVIVGNTVLVGTLSVVSAVGVAVANNMCTSDASATQAGKHGTIEAGFARGVVSGNTYGSITVGAATLLPAILTDINDDL